jgi:hypothetical protein
LASLSIENKAAKLFYAAQRNYIGRLAMVEVDFNHQVSAALNYLCRWISRSSD